MSQKMKVSELKAHPQNNYFFDDMVEDAWGEFVESVKTSGVIEPIVVTQDKVIVSGHQRVRACKVLGIKEIDAEVRIIESEDEVLKQLIETNIRQRGVGNPNPIKFGRCLVELERIYGIQHGAKEFQGNQHSEVSPNNSDSPKTQSDLASELGISVDTLNNYKRLAQAIPEVQELVESGKVTKTVALSMLKKLTEDEQRDIADMYSGSDKKISEREIKFYKDRIATLEKQKTKTVEVIPDDYEELKEQLANAENNAERLKAECETLKEQATVNNPLEDAKREMRVLIAKYGDLKELSKVIKAMEAVLKEG